MKSAWRSAVAIVLVAGAAAAARAQPAAQLPDPESPSRVQLGPVGLRPALVLREIGYDSNVLNEGKGEQGDFTATVGGRLDLVARLARIVASSNSFYEYVYFQDFTEERGSNRGASGRMDVLLGRLRPHVVAGLRTSHDRPSAEIDARALRQQSRAGLGLAAEATSRVALNVAWRRNGTDYADDEEFRGVDLATQLNEHADSLTYGADFKYSPLTTISVHGEELRERFTHSPDRDADSHRYGMTALLNPLALVSGRATVGFAAFRPRNPQEPDFTGLVAAVDVAYAYREESRVGLIVDRDVRHSYLDETPYYVSTGIRGTYTQRLVRNLDGQILGGWERVAYQALLDALAPPGDPDRVATYGAGVGVRLADDSRVAINFDHSTRSSTVPSRDYKRNRVLATVTYGF